jgi:gamma-glutamyltranspeptidase
MAQLEAGGNAFDAAIAGAFVLHVVEPHLNGPAGEVPAIFATATDPVPRVLCGQGTAPAGATREHYLDLGLELVPGSGPLAAAIPGAVDAWLMLGRDHGTRSLRDVLARAIGYARCPGSSSPTRSTRRPSNGWSSRVRLRAAAARRSTTGLGAPGARGSWPRRSTRSAGCRSVTPAAPTTPGC